MIRRPPRSTRTDTLFPTRRSSDLVGMTGWATGPHLHYEFRVNNKARDPMAIDIPNARPLTAMQMQQFKRSEEHTSELQSLMRISYAVFCLTKKNTHHLINIHLTLYNKKV